VLAEVTVAFNIGVDTARIVEFDDVTFAWARTTNTELDENSTAMMATVTRMPVMIRLPNPETFSPM
jgi:hypothetical protein